MRYLSIDGVITPIRGGFANTDNGSIDTTVPPDESTSTAVSLMTSMITEGLNDI